MVDAANGGAFDAAAWGAAIHAAEARDFDQTLAAIAAQRDMYASQLGAMSDADFRVEIEMFGPDGASLFGRISQKVVGK